MLRGEGTAMQTLTRIIPPLTIIAATILVALPWGMSAENRFFLPLLPLTVIYYWSNTRSSSAPEWLAFLSGLAFDILTNSPLGFWALIYLLGYFAGRLTSSQTGGGPFIKWFWYGVSLVALVGIAWSISSIYHMRFDDWWPYVTAAIGAVLVFPLISALLFGLDLRQRQLRRSGLERGGSRSAVAR
jgi:rod shape-determining protein MreD